MIGSAMPPADAEAQLADVLGKLRGDNASVARISGFHDASGDAATNAALAKERADGVAQWLEAQGVAAERIMLERPAETIQAIREFMAATPPGAPAGTAAG